MTEHRASDKRGGAHAIPALLMILALVLGTVTGCAAQEPDQTGDGKMKIVTTIFPPYDFARAVIGSSETADIKMLLSPGEEVHSYEPTPLDIREIQDCDLFIYVGGENDVWVERILELDAQYRQIAENAARKTIVFGDRFPIRYFAEEYGLDYFAAFAGCSSEAEPSASTLAFLIDKVKEEEIPVVFTIEFSNGNIARAICESTGAEQRRFETCHNVTKEQMDSGATYVSLMTGNLESVREALGDRDE